jgi:hypothetical protein
MLYRELLTSELDKQRDDFRRFSDSQASDLTDYLHKLKRLNETPYEQIRQNLIYKNAGAIPSEEFDQLKTFSVKFAESWANHEEARVWANEILNNRTTFAADGSQLFSERDVSLPVGAIQIGWFENPHSASQRYEKSAYFEILSPEVLLQEQEEPIIPETRVGERRFHAEVEKASEFLTKKKDWRGRGEKMPLAFFDGTLLVSFSLPQTDLQDTFIKKMVGLVKLSRETEVPVIGYVDRSYARDLMNLLDTLDNVQTSKKQTLYDASILQASTEIFAQTLSNWGDRTCFCFSKRKGLKAFLDGEPLVGFTYLQTTSEGAPARIDIPGWIYEKGLLEELLNVVRAECVIGLGYPYALETADQTALITMRDREVFLRALQDFASREKLNFNVSRKTASKGRRR